MENDKLDYLVTLSEANLVTLGVVITNMNHLQAKIEDRSLEDITKETKIKLDLAKIEFNKRFTKPT